MTDNDVKKEKSNEDYEYYKDIFLSELQESLHEMNEMRKNGAEVN